MKRLILILLLFAAAGCGSGSEPAAELPSGSDLRVDLSYTIVKDGREIEAIFYFSNPTASGVKTAPPRQSVAVEGPTFNGSPMTPVQGDAEHESYKFTHPNPSKENTVTAKLNGKVYEGKAVLELLAGNRMTSVTLLPKN